MEALAVFAQLTFYDLNAVEIRALRILHRPEQKYG